MSISVGENTYSRRETYHFHDGGLDGATAAAFAATSGVGALLNVLLCVDERRLLGADGWTGD